MKDTFGRTIDYLRLSITDRCNLRCVYCMPKDGVPIAKHEEILRLEEFARIVEVAARLGIKHVRLTGGEPLVRKGCVELARQIASTPGIESVAITTNGILLPRFAKELKQAGVSRVNISLDTLDPDRYRTITRLGNVSDALAGIDAAFAAGFDPTKVNVVAVRELAQDWESFARLTVDRPLHVRFIEYMPVGGNAEFSDCTWGPEDVIPSAELRETISGLCEKSGLGRLEPAEEKRPAGDGPAAYWRLPEAKGTIGFISSVSDHFCARCNRMRVTADGKIRPCLFSDREFDVRSALRRGGGDAVADMLAEALQAKPENHAHRVGTKRMMSQVGG